MPALDNLNNRFGLKGAASFETGAGDLPVVKIANALATATVALQGAHLLAWQPRGQQPVIWLSQQAKFAPGKSVRGGVPVCWPWFGAHAADASFPAHGFARTVPWSVVETRTLAGGATEIRFRPQETDVTRRQWPHAAPVECIITVGTTLTIVLVTHNHDAHAVTIGQALHTYFAVSDIRQVSVSGLDGCEYLDKPAGFARRRQTGVLRFEAETDRIYLGTNGDCAIEDPGLKRRIRITSAGSRSTVVWTPWAEKAAAMGDFGDNGWTGMLCVETANAAEDLVSIAPGGEHRMRATYAVEPL